jgi:hypothetical protein
MSGEVMKKFAGIVVVTLLAGWLTGCTGDGGGGSAPAASVTPEVRSYPLEVCVVSGEELGTMGEPYVHVHGNREIKFCCRPCLKEFDRDPEGYVQKIDLEARGS